MVDEKTYFLETKTAMNEVMGRLTGKKWFEGIKTGFFDIDKWTGGFENKKLIILGGRPAMGKTALALNMLKNIAVTNKVPSVCFSLAVPKNEILRRLLYLKARRAIYPDSAITEKQATAVFTPIAEEIGNSPVLILDDYVRIDDIVGKCMELKEKSGIGFVVIDYLQLVRDSEEFSGYAEALNEIARKLNKMGECGKYVKNLFILQNKAYNY